MTVKKAYYACTTLHYITVETHQIDCSIRVTGISVGVGDLPTFFLIEVKIPNFSLYLLV